MRCRLLFYRTSRGGGEEGGGEEGRGEEGGFSRWGLATPHSAALRGRKSKMDNWTFDYSVCVCHFKDIPDSQ